MNTDIFYFFYHLSHRSSGFDQVAIFITDKADKIVLALAAVFLFGFFLLHRDWKDKEWFAWLKEGATVFVSVVGAYAVSYVLKLIFHAPRPFVTHGDVHPLVVETPLSSFPSGHATLFFALAMAIYLYNKPAGWVFFLFAIIIALSRIVVGVHYPLDIVVGAVIGVGMAYILYRIVNSIFSRKNL